MGPVGPAGPPGPAGPAGPQGPPGTIGSTQVVTASATGTSPQMNTTATATAACPTGTVLLGGGGAVVNSNASEPANVQLIASRPGAGNSWVAIGVIDVGLGQNNSMTVTAYALCSA